MKEFIEGFISIVSFKNVFPLELYDYGVIFGAIILILMLYFSLIGICFILN